MGVGLAGVAALLFGVIAPLVQRASEGAGALSAGGLIYLGAAMISAGGLVRRKTRTEAPIRRAQIAPLCAIALFGGLLAPALLVLGLQRTNGATAALLLALEAPFTVLLARLIYGEHLGWRVSTATLLIFMGAVLAVGFPPAGITFQGGLLVGAATLAWAADNIVSRSLADRDPLLVVAGKGAIGGLAAVLTALVVGQPWPTLRGAGLLFVTGGLGFGVSLHLYLRAQRIIGAARTASVFAIAPCLGAATALALGTPWPGWSFALAACLISGGVWLHAFERHEHTHSHAEIAHEHVHAHDDGHHNHAHHPMPGGPHSHLHCHNRLVHSHTHSEDAHHRHDH